jgi:hypothetical protein
MIPTTQFRKAMHEIAAKQGDFTLFALFQRANGLGDWDLVVAAPWLKVGGYRDISKVVDGVIESIGRRPLRYLAQVAVVPEKQPAVKSILASLPVEDGEMRLGRTDLFGHEMLQGVIFRAMKPPAHRNGVSAKARRRTVARGEALGSRGKPAAAARVH